jgi:hypothetical protein
MPSGLTTSSDAPVWDWLRMRQAIVRPLNSIFPDFKALHSNSALPRHVITIRTHRQSAACDSHGKARRMSSGTVVRRHFFAA